MSGHILIAIISAGTSIVAALLVALPKIIEQYSLAKDRSHARKYADRLWQVGQYETATSLVVWLRNPLHAPPDLTIRYGSGPPPYLSSMLRPARPGIVSDVNETTKHLEEV